MPSASHLKIRAGDCDTSVKRFDIKNRIFFCYPILHPNPFPDMEECSHHAISGVVLTLEQTRPCRLIKY